MRDIYGNILTEHKRSIIKPNHEWPDDVNRALSWIEQNLFCPNYSVEKMMLECNIASKNFSSKFRFYIGETPVTYIKNQRLKMAIKLMQQEELMGESLGMIAMVVGYENPSSFNKAFKSVYGVTTLEKRQELLQEKCQKDMTRKL